MQPEQLKVFGVEWCGDCRRVRRFLESHQIAYEWINVDRDKEGEAFVIKTNRGNRSVPTMVFPDGSIMVEPRTSQLIERFEPMLETS